MIGKAIYLVEVKFNVTKNKRSDVITRNMVAREILEGIFDKKDILERFILREDKKTATIAGIKKLKVMGYVNEESDNQK